MLPLCASLGAMSNIVFRMMRRARAIQERIHTLLILRRVLSLRARALALAVMTNVPLTFGFGIMW